MSKLRKSVGEVLIAPVIASVVALCIELAFFAVPFEPQSVLSDR